MADQPLSAVSGGRAAALVARNHDALEASCSVRLLTEMSDGTVGDETFARYLAIEQAFVRTATRLAGYCLWQQPEWSRAERHAAAVVDLVGPQSAYFARLVESRPVEAELVPDLLGRASVLEDTVTTALDDGGYAAVVTSLAAAETLYLLWCTRAAARSDERPGAVQQWIGLHVTEGFRAQVAFLHELVDELPTSVTDARLDGWFGDMLAAEDAFHASPYAEVVA